MTATLPLLVTLLTILLSPSLALAQPASALNALAAKQPTVQWQSASTLSLDVNCDGVPDQTLLGIGPGQTVWLGVVTSSVTNSGARSAPMLLRFRIGGAGQDAFCASPVRLAAEPLVCVDDDIGKLPGCHPRAGCSSLLLEDEQCDAIRVYVDRRRQMLRWWRR